MMAIEAQVLPSFQPPLYASPQRTINGQLPPTKGYEVAAWQQRWLVHGEGDFKGRRRQLAAFQLYVLLRALEYDPADGHLLYDRVVVGMPKGCSKSEDAAAYGIGELYGPVRPLSSPRVVVQAASYDQAGRSGQGVYGAAKTMVDEGPLAPRFQTFDNRLYPHVGGGIMERRAAIAGTSEGGLPTVAIGDELHEWRTERQKGIYTVQSLNLRKRLVPRHGGISGAQQFSMSTAGDDFDSLLGELYQHGVKVASGEVEDPTLLFLWWEAPKLKDEDLNDPVQRRERILLADPAIGHFKTLAQVEAGFIDPTIERHDIERRSLNRWVTNPFAWLPAAYWNEREMAQATAAKKAGGSPPAAPDGTRIVLGFKGSYDRNTTAIVGWTLPDQGEWSDYGFVVEKWEPDGHDPDWTVPRDGVDAAVYAAMSRWKVVELACDPVGWVSEVDAWAAEFGVRTVDSHDKVKGSGIVHRFDNVNPRMGPACDRFKADVLNPESSLQHSGDPALARHIKNARRRTTRYGAVIELDKKESPRKIDLAQAAVIARQRAMHQPAPRRRGVAAGF